VQFDRLRLQGFKSFVDPTEMAIREGLTGVVGPNGCGKSNLLEALRWVMGETRASAVRGEGMEDVIFAGTDSRPARARASVELVLDNAERLAPAAFNAVDRIEISRRIARDIGSAYSVNGRSVRARDVQMLFADASTGAHSPALVRQGQIAELISARPKARRRVLEEAAGISGLYQRRHEAELKLNAAETNLARVDDQIETLEAQARSLGRQAGQARRYREIAQELRRVEATVLWLRWHGAETARAEAECARLAATAATARAESAAGRSARARDAAEAALAPLREEAEVGAALLHRAAIERDRLEGAHAAAAEEIATLERAAADLARDLDRERALDRDAAGALAALAAEETRLAAAAEGQETETAEAQEAARVAGEMLAEAEAVHDALAADAARLAAGLQAAERRLTEIRAAETRIAAALRETETALSALTVEQGDAAAAVATAGEALSAARAAAAEADARLTEAAGRRGVTDRDAAAARAARAEAEGAAAALRAELGALDALLARDGGGGDRLLDRLSVAPGFEAALGAALGDDLTVRAEAGETGSGWVGPAAPVPATPLPEGTAPLAAQVSAPGLLAARLSQIGLVAAGAGDAMQTRLAPGQRLVSREGDLWRWDGLRLRAGDAPSAAALRLEQRNRRAALATALDEAEATATERRAGDAAAAAAAREADRAETAAREARTAAERRASEAERALSTAEARAERAGARRQTAEDRLEAQRAERAAATAAREEAEAACAGLDDPAALDCELAEARRAVETGRAGLLAARSRAEDLRRQAAGREKRRAAIARDRAGWARRQETAGGRLADLEARAAATASRLSAARARPAEIADLLERAEAGMRTAESRRRAAADALAEGESALAAATREAREAERVASAAREAHARADAVLEGTLERVATAAAAIAEKLDAEPADLAGTLGLDTADIPALDRVEAEHARLVRARDALGAVNLRAEADLVEVEAARDALAAEKADLDAAIAKLRGAIRSLNREGRERLVAAFDAVNAKFADLFRSLFGGGEARLVMVESEDPLEAGLEILCQPPGKKLSTLSLLSGGEQTLTALSLIFAVFLTNPAPICVLDEVDAPLDDANVARFCDLLDAMRSRTRTRFLVITHNAITMSRMDRLYGVTMVERGVSQLVSVDLARAEEMAAR